MARMNTDKKAKSNRERQAAEQRRLLLGWLFVFDPCSSVLSVVIPLFPSVFSVVFFLAEVLSVYQSFSFFVFFIRVHPSHPWFILFSSLFPRCHPWFAFVPR
jgi:uncharacterized membrane protein